MARHPQFSLRRAQAEALRLGRALRTKPWLKPLRNASVLSFGRGAQAILELLALALAARALTPETFGLLVLLHSLVNAVGGLTKFKSAPTIIRYGSDALERGDKTAFQRLIKFTLRLDALGALLALALMMGGLNYAMAWFQVPENVHDVVRIYALTVVVIALNDSPNGVLRVLDRFALVSIHATVMPAIRAAGAAVLLVVGGGLEAFLLLWMAAQVGGRVANILLAATAMHRHGLLSGMLDRHGRVWRPVPGVWRYVLGTQAASSVAVAQNHLGVLMVGALLGPAAGGLFRIGQGVAGVVVRPLQKLLKPALFPEIARQTARGDRKLRRKLVLRHSALAMGFALLLFLGLAIFGRSVLTVAMGEAYAAAYGVMLLIALAGVVRAAILPVEPLLYATGHVRIVLSAQVSALIVFVPALYGGVLWLNVLGAGLAAVVHAVALSAFFLLFGRRVILGHLAIIAPEAKAAQ